MSMEKSDHLKAEFKDLTLFAKICTVATKVLLIVFFVLFVISIFKPIIFWFIGCAVLCVTACLFSNVGFMKARKQKVNILLEDHGCDVRV